MKFEHLSKSSYKKEIKIKKKAPPFTFEIKVLEYMGFYISEEIILKSNNLMQNGSVPDKNSKNYFFKILFFSLVLLLFMALFCCLNILIFEESKISFFEIIFTLNDHFSMSSSFKTFFTVNSYFNSLLIDLFNKIF